MPNRNPVIFKRSLLAVAIVSLSACSTTPHIEDYDLSRVGEGILKAGRTTADVSERVWNRTTYLLGFSDGDTVSDESLLMDEVDLAMAKEDAVLPSDMQIRPVSVPQAIANTQPGSVETLDDTAVTIIAPDAAAPDMASAELIDTTSAVVVVEDLVHEVVSAETLWDIAKKTTGDANNWHVLADVNNLSPNASVYPGQQLIVPSDMVKPGYFDAPESANPQAQTTAEPKNIVNTQDLASNDSLAAPEIDEAVTIASASDAETGKRLVIPASDANDQPTQSEAANDTAIKLTAGETLWDFAKRTTGDATNWQAIANHNNFSEKQAVVVQAGQSIRVPESLLKTELDVAAVEPLQSPQVAAAAPAISETVTQIVSPATNMVSIADETAVEASSELLAEASTLDETQLVAAESAPITIVEATFKTDSEILPKSLDSTATDAAAMTMKDVSHGEIMVSGTYYPKAIYNDPDFSSSLLMRVSPGTTLQVSKAMEIGLKLKPIKVSAMSISVMSNSSRDSVFERIWYKPVSLTNTLTIR